LKRWRVSDFKLGDNPDKPVFDVLKFEEEVMLEKAQKMEQLKEA